MQEKLISPADRVLHMSDQCREHLEQVRSWAIINDMHGKFLEALDYCRTFSGGPEKDWKSVLTLDMPFRKDDKNFILQVYRRYPIIGPAGNEIGEGLRNYMTIGMILHKGDKEWTFHS